MGHAVDAQSNTITLFSVLEQVGGPNLPLALPTFVIVTLWQREEGEEGAKFFQRTRLIAPDGEEIFNLEADFRLHKIRHRMFLTVGGTPFKMEGRYNIEVSIRREEAGGWGEPVAVYPIQVAIAEAPSATPLLDEPPGT